MFSISTFNELMKGLPRKRFDALVNKHKGDKYAKTFGHWEHLIAMLYAQLSGVSSLRTLEIGFNSHPSHHYHLGVDAPIKRTTVADANAKRSDVIFAETAGWLMKQVCRQVRSESAELMYLLDSTSLTLKGREFDRWTLDNRTRNTQGIKVHVLLDAATQAPDWYSFSAANVNDIEKAWDVPLQRGALYVFDKGYYDYSWWHAIQKAGALFVTRFKKNAGLSVVEEREVPANAVGVIKDEIVRLKHSRPGGRDNPYITTLRRVTIARPDKATDLVLATNDLESPAEEIARRYKERWNIELFFKWIKQHLKIKAFLGRTENAVRIQVLTALISYLLVALHKQRSDIQGTLWECLVLVRETLFQRGGNEISRYRRQRRHREELALRQGNLF
jgi:putative transposase